MHIEMEKMQSEEQDLEAMIPAVILPDGYRGKILLVLITQGGRSIMALRSGDLWHREILRNTRAEMIRIGLRDVRVEEMGGGVPTLRGGWVDKDMGRQRRVWGL